MPPLKTWVSLWDWMDILSTLEAIAAGRESTERCIVSRFPLALATLDLTTLRPEEIACE